MIIDVPKIKSGFPGLLGDIESHLPVNHPYKDRDKITYAHEGTHGVNNIIRNGYAGNNNAAYLLGDKAYLWKEPDIKLSDVAKAIPAELRKTGYQLYLVEQQRYWNNQPLYVLDELSCYLNGTKVGMDLNVDHGRIEYSLIKTIEFLGYSLILITLVSDWERHEIEVFPRYVNDYVITMLKEFPSAHEEYKKLKGHFPVWY